MESKKHVCMFSGLEYDESTMIDVSGLFRPGELESFQFIPQNQRKVRQTETRAWVFTPKN